MRLAAPPAASAWPRVREVLCALGADRSVPPIVLSSLPEAARATFDPALPPFTFIHGPAGRNIALAIGLRAALPSTPLVLVMNADSVTLGTNHLIHAARRNIGMTLLLLRAELTRGAAEGTLDRTSWSVPDYQRDLEAAPRPLDWAIALEAAFVARACLDEPGALEALLRQSIAGGGFSVIGVTTDPGLATGVLGACAAPEYFARYREWARPLRSTDPGTHPGDAPRNAPARPGVRPGVERERYEVRIAGMGGHGIKLAGSVLSEAAGLHEGMWATQRGDYGSATRGGPSSVDVVIGSRPITYPGADHADALVVLTQAAADRYGRNLKPGARLIVDSAEVREAPAGAIAVPIAALARAHTGKPIAAGVVALGCVAALGGAVSRESIARALPGHVPAALVERNIAACAAGFEATRAALGG